MAERWADKWANLEKNLFLQQKKTTKNADDYEKIGNVRYNEL